MRGGKNLACIVVEPRKRTCGQGLGYIGNGAERKGTGWIGGDWNGSSGVELKLKIEVPVFIYFIF